MKFILAFMAVFSASPVLAHQLNDDSIVIVKIWQSSEGMVRGIIDDTHNGAIVRCAFYDKQEKILAVDSFRTEDFATEFLLSAPNFYASDIASYKCRKN